LSFILNEIFGVFLVILAMVRMGVSKITRIVP